MHTYPSATHLLLLSTLLVSFSTSCIASEGELDEPTTGDAAPSRTLTVVGGSGSGTYQPGQEVHVFAEVDPYRSVVTGWQSSRGKQLASNEWHIVFTMPDEDTTLTPEIVEIPMELTEVELAGVARDKRVIYAIPANPKGVIFLFHGTEGSADFIHAPSAQYVARLAYHRGYAVVSTEAEERTLDDPGPDGKTRWNANDVLENNIDLQNIQLLSERISELTAIPADAPRYAIGMSNGGAFAVTVGASLPFTAVADFCSTGNRVAIDATETPTQWLMCSNDTNENVSGKRDQWMDGTNELARRSIATAYTEHPPSPVFDGRFARIENVDLDTSAAAVAELAANGELDADGFLLRLPDDIIADIVADPLSWPAMNTLAELTTPNRVRGELKHAYADHQMYDDLANRVLDFFAAQVK